MLARLKARALLEVWAQSTRHAVSGWPTTRPDHHRETEEANAPLKLCQYFEKN
jgi:hypothetical protein